MTTANAVTVNSRHALEDITVFGLIYPEVIKDLKRALRELNDSPFQIAFATTGLGALINTLIWGLGGCSKTLRNSLFTYDTSSTVELVGRTIATGEFTKPATASGMSAAVLFKGYQRLFEGKEVAKVPHLIGAAMCGAVQTCRVRKGLDVAEMSFRMLRDGLIKEWTVSLELDKSYSRGWQDILACLVFLNGILAVARLEQVHLPLIPELKNELMHFIEDHLDIVPTLYTIPSFKKMIIIADGIEEKDDHLIVAPHPYSFSLKATHDLLMSEGAIVVNPDGTIAALSSLAGKQIVDVSTSANPLSPLHFLLMREGLKAVEGGIPVLDLCLGNPDKGEIDLEEIAARASQAHGLCHIIIRTGSGKFIDKVAPGQRHVIGIDTAVRILDLKYYGTDDTLLVDKRKLVIEMLQKFVANDVVFYVVDRCGYSTSCRSLIGSQPGDIRGLLYELFQQLHTGTKSCAISSTQMRNAENAVRTIP